LGSGGASLEDSGARLRRRSVAGVEKDGVDAYRWSTAAIDRSSSSPHRTLRRRGHAHALKAMPEEQGN
jgi:hypothetical protein